MSSDKRLILCFILSLVFFLGTQALLVQTGMIPPDRPAAKKAALQKGGPVPPVADDGPERTGELPADPFQPAGGPEVAAAPGGPAPADPATPEEVPADQLVLGAVDPAAASPFKLQLQLSQEDASVARATSSLYNGELDPNNPKKKPGRLVLIRDNPLAKAAPGSLALFISPEQKRGAGAPVDGDAEADAVPAQARRVEAIPRWEVVRDGPDGAPVRSLSKVNPTTRATVAGQELRFRARLAQPAVEVTKVFRIWEGEEGFEVDLRFGNPTGDARLTYRLIGPHGIPIEGDWYTTNFRDVFFGVQGSSGTTVDTRTAYDAHKNLNDPTQRLSTNPLQFAGVEDQYFATFVQPVPVPKVQDERWDASAEPLLIQVNREDPSRADLTVAIDSKPIAVGPNLGEVVHTYRVYAGPKAAASLAPYGATELASYRKYQLISIPFAATLARNVIVPLLGKIYLVTESIAQFFGGKNGNYGVAIILLTMTVRLFMFPLGRKQAMMAKKMQDLQPVLAEVREKYKDDKEAAAKETMAVYKRHKLNPAAGCLPALIQMPIFVGLWQSLNNSFELRQSTFLWIHDLAAPDQTLRFPVVMPFLGQFLNILPFAVVALMMVQTKLFSPPPTTPEAEAQQKMMKYMMVFMAFMFYKVPSGLGLYFITSSLWQIGERLLLPKIMKDPKPAPEVELAGDRGGPRGGSPRTGPGGNGTEPKAQGWLGKRLEKLLEDAAKETTIRNTDRNGDRDRPRGRNGDGNGNGFPNGDGNRPRSKPPGKRR